MNYLVFAISTTFLESAWAAPSGDQSGWNPDAAWTSQTSHGYQGPTAIPEVRPDGTLVDTAEVAAAKIAHLAALEAARTSNPDMDDGLYDPVKYGDHLYHGSVQEIVDNGLFYGNVAKSEDAGSVHWQKNALAEAEAALALWKAKTPAASSAPSDTKPYSGPLAMLRVLPSGYLEDTPEVEAARNIYLRALEEAQAAAKLWEEQTHPKEQTKQKGWQ